MRRGGITGIFLLLKNIFSVDNQVFGFHHSSMEGHLFGILLEKHSLIFHLNIELGNEHFNQKEQSLNQLNSEISLSSQH